MSKNYVEVEYENKKAETDKAVLLIVDGDEFWVPLSQCEDNGELDEFDGRIYITQWMADNLEIPYNDG